MKPNSAASPLGGNVLTLSPVRDFFRRYRGALIFGLALILFSGFGLVGSAWWIAPVIRLMSVEVYLGFSGAQDGKYPNGLPFSPEDLLDPAVLRPVYDQHQLSPYIQFSDFQAALSISQESKDLMGVIREYEARLRDGKFSGPDRKIIETEYRSRLRNAASTLYILSWYENGKSPSRVSEEVKAKVLLDIPKVWANRVIETKQALLFSSRLLGVNPVSPSIRTSSLEFFSTLEAGTRAISEGLSSIDKLPGAVQASLKDGTTMIDLHLRLRTFKEQTLPSVQEFLLTQLESNGEIRRLQEAVELQLKFRESREEEAKLRLSALVDSYRDFLASRPGGPALSEEGDAISAGANLDEIFLTRIVRLTQGTPDATYLRKMVQEIEQARLALAQESAAVSEMRQNLELVRGTVLRLGTERAVAAPLQLPPPQEDLRNPASIVPPKESSAQLERIRNNASQIVAIISECYLGKQTQLFNIFSEPKVVGIRNMGIARMGLAFIAWLVLGMTTLILLLMFHDRSMSLRRSMQKR